MADSKSQSESKPVSSKKKREGNFKDFLKQRRSYILGILVGIVLITINAYVGLYMIDILLSEDIIAVVPGVSLPAIHVSDYETVRDSYLSRQQKVLPPASTSDPYHTTP